MHDYCWNKAINEVGSTLSKYENTDSIMQTIYRFSSVSLVLESL